MSDDFRLGVTVWYEGDPPDKEAIWKAIEHLGYPVSWVSMFPEYRNI